MSGDGRTPGPDDAQGSTAIVPVEGEKLPLVVVDRTGAAGPSNQLIDRLNRVPLGVRIAALIAIVAISGFVGAVVGLYRQPTGAQWAMRTLGLEPGAGTTKPIAVPLKRAAGGEPADSAPATNATPQAASARTISGLGKIEPEGEVITIATPSGVRDARVDELHVEAGAKVTAGQIIATLDNRERLEAIVEAARANVALRQATLDQVRQQSTASRGEAQAALARAEAAHRNAELDFKRTRQLYERKIVSKATFDLKEAAMIQAAREVDQARAVLSRYRDTTPDGPTDVVVAMRQLDTARAELRRAKADVEQAIVRAPAAGTILDVFVRPGETPGQRGVAELGQLDHMMARVEIYETEAGRVAVGQPVVLRADALSKPLAGTVSRVGLRVRKQEVIASDPAATTDARVIEVMVSLDDPSSKAASRFTNLQVVATITTGTGGDASQ
jgi:HlyD family secretion protein